MSRNRMKNSQSLHWMGVLKWVIMFGLIAGLGLCYMICKNQNLHLADEAKLQQKKLGEIEARNGELALDLQRMKSITFLRRQLAFNHSTLVPLGDGSLNVVRFDQDVRARLARPGVSPSQTLNNFDASVVAASAAASAGH